MLTDPDKHFTGNREPAYEKFSDEVYREDPTQDILDWLQPFTVDLEDLEIHVLAHSSDRVNSDSEGDASKEEISKSMHRIHTNFRKY